MYTLGIDLGSSSVKVSVLDVDSGKCLGSAYSPEKAMAIIAPKAGWAEQDPTTWWENTKLAILKVLSAGNISARDISAVGIAYQMHGLVAVDKNHLPVRPSIIWCDSRAIETGDRIFSVAGKDKCMSHLLNSPANFTLSKLLWVKEHEPEIYEKIHKIMLPGDYLAMRLTGEINTTASGLSEAILWDFKAGCIAGFVLEAAGIEKTLIPELVPTFGIQGYLSKEAAFELGLPEGIPLTYRAGDQPNNAFSLNVLNPGEIAATAGTSGVVYGVTDEIISDPYSRVNTFAHVNHSVVDPRFGVLLCINGTGISNSWIRKITGAADFEFMNKKALEVLPGSEGLLFLPFGNGAERMLNNRQPGSSFFNIDFNTHRSEHLFRAVQEGVAFAFNYGIQILAQMAMKPTLIRAGNANMFLSKVFCNSLSAISNTSIELFNTDGSVGAARASAFGAGFYKDYSECFKNLVRISEVEPDPIIREQLLNAYYNWEKIMLKQFLQR